MGVTDTVQLFLVGLYITAGVILLFTAYAIYTKRYRNRGKIQMMNNVTLTTSRYDIYHANTQFLLHLPKPCSAELNLLDASENLVRTLINEKLEPGQHMIPFDIDRLNNGVYFLSLKTDHATLLRKITIEKKS